MIEPCKACFGCGGERNCTQNNDMFREIFEKAIQADGILLGSPVYTADISANMQAFLERASVVTDMNRDAKLFQHKVGASLVAEGGSERATPATFLFIGGEASNPAANYGCRF